VTKQGFVVYSSYSVITLVEVIFVELSEMERIRQDNERMKKDNEELMKQLQLMQAQFSQMNKEN